MERFLVNRFYIEHIMTYRDGTTNSGCFPHGYRDWQSDRTGASPSDWQLVKTSLIHEIVSFKQLCYIESLTI